MKKFKIGDRVRHRLLGKVGIICEIKQYKKKVYYVKIDNEKGAVFLALKNEIDILI